MNNSKLLVKAGCVMGASGLAILFYSFFSMYSLTGDCPSGNEECTAYSTWQITNRVGLFLLGVGALVLIFGLIRRNQK